MTLSVLTGGNGLPGFDRVPIWFNDPSNWWGPDGLVIRIREHLLYTASAVLIAVLIALPLGLLVGHTGRGVFLLVGSANGLRAVPSLGLLILLYIWLSPKIHSKADIPYFIERGGLGSFIPALIVLVVLALPPLLTNTYAGVQNVDPAARDAARGMGMTGFQVLRKVEFPCALPLIMSGLRSATLQVIATVAVAAYLPFLGGLGRYIIEGSQTINDLKFGYPAMLAAGITVAVLAVLADGLLSLVQRLVVSPGLSDRTTKRSGRARSTAASLSGEARLSDA
jgi:osmoprotectant transport system permease protein